MSFAQALLMFSLVLGQHRNVAEIIEPSQSIDLTAVFSDGETAILHWNSGSILLQLDGSTFPTVTTIDDQGRPVFTANVNGAIVQGLLDVNGDNHLTGWIQVNGANAVSWVADAAYTATAMSDCRCSGGSGGCTIQKCNEGGPCASSAGNCKWYARDPGGCPVAVSTVLTVPPAIFMAKLGRRRKRPLHP